MPIDFRERGKEGDREGEKHQSVASPAASTMSPDWETEPIPRHVP